ncbi:MAG: SM-20-related protein [Thermoleophilaceae bacterium]|nr:SM-20-related protein [Thermoleophilaceae bacterium]
MPPAIDFLEIGNALDPPLLDAVRQEMRVAAGSPATVTGVAPDRAVEFSARSATQIALSGSTRAAVTELLEHHRPRVAAHFGRSLGECEEPQFLRYVPGDYFVAHQDGNTPLVHDHTRFRKVSVVVFLSEQSADPAPATYSGGSLVLHGPFGEDLQVPLAPAPGTLVAFPSETTHEVTPITRGERLSIVSWYRAAE